MNDGNCENQQNAPAPSPELDLLDAVRALLIWHTEAGADETVSISPTDFKEFKDPRNLLARRSTAVGNQSALAPPSNSTNLRRKNTTTGGSRAPKTTVQPNDRADNRQGGIDKPVPADEAVRQAELLSQRCETIEALSSAVEGFEGCALKSGARSTVFIDGSPQGSLLVIGEAPGREEDRIGKPFVGRAGQLLERMLHAIGRSRDTNTLVSNVIFWRPPGNRTPTQAEVMVCRPFVDRLIELQRPRAIVLAGGAPTQALLGLTGIMRSRGKWHTYETSNGERIPALPIFHPAFLLRQPAQKRLAWADLKKLSEKLCEN
ncbi:MAG: uracil-DNA glycosylase [Pseudomonadota bacterium]